VVVVPVISGAFQATIPAFPDDITSVTGRAIDAAGNEQQNSVFLGAQVSDQTPPAPPAVLTSSVPTPSLNDTSFQVGGQAEALASIELFTDPACTVPLPSPEVATTVATSTGSWRRAVTVPAAASTSIYATATDVAGNRSACASNPFTFTNTSSGPAWDSAISAADHVDASIALDSTGTAYALQTFSQPPNVIGLSLVSAPPGSGWTASGTILETTSGPTTQFALALEDDRPLILYGSSGSTQVEMRSTTLGADGQLTAFDLFSTHPFPAAKVRALSLATDRNGGAWAAWAVQFAAAVVGDTPAADELWVARHTRAGGWSAPVRLAAASGRVSSLRLAAAPSGHAAIAWEASQFPGFPPDEDIYSFFDPQTGWGDPQGFGTLNADARTTLTMDDAGHAMTVIVDQVNRSVRLTRHEPGGWAELAEQFAPGPIDQIRLATNGAGDAVLAWTVLVSDFGVRQLFVQRYSAGAGLHDTEQRGTAFALSQLSLTADGSIWFLSNGMTPDAVFADLGLPPTWLQRFEVGTGWLSPMVVIGDGGGCGNLCQPELARNDAGTALIPWTNDLVAPLGTWLRWFRLPLRSE
jgi:hypothetical protein